MKMFLTVKNKYKMIYTRSSANGVAFMDAKNSRQILALGSKQLLRDTKQMLVFKSVSGFCSFVFRFKGISPKKNKSPNSHTFCFEI